MVETLGIEDIKAKPSPFYSFEGTPCLIPNMGLSRRGHHIHCHEGKTAYYHRTIFEKFYGKLVGPDEIVHHRCETKRCANPLHFEKKDRVPHSREHNLGENNPNSKVSLELMLQIREICATGLSTIKIAKQFGLSKGCIDAIKHRRTWSHIE